MLDFEAFHKVPLPMVKFCLPAGLCIQTKSSDWNGACVLAQRIYFLASEIKIVPCYETVLITCHVHKSLGLGFPPLKYLRVCHEELKGDGDAVVVHLGRRLCSLFSAVTETLLTQCQPPWAFLPLLSPTHPHPHPALGLKFLLYWAFGIVSWRTRDWWCPLLIRQVNLGLIRRVLVVDAPSLDQRCLWYGA